MPTLTGSRSAPQDCPAARKSALPVCRATSHPVNAVTPAELDVIDFVRGLGLDKSEALRRLSLPVPAGSFGVWPVDPVIC